MQTPYLCVPETIGRLYSLATLRQQGLCLSCGLLCGMVPPICSAGSLPHTLTLHRDSCLVHRMILLDIHTLP